MMELLSALMDGELESPLDEQVIDSLEKTRRWRREWELYHLIGDCLRRPFSVSQSVVFSATPKFPSGVRPFSEFRPSLKARTEVRQR